MATAADTKAKDDKDKQFTGKQRRVSRVSRLGIPQLVCPMCDQRGLRLGEACSKHRLFLVSPKSLEEAPRGHPLGQFVDERYAVLGMLGRGGMGTVYWAIQHPIGRRAAVKVLRSDLTAEAAAEERFLREARAIASVHHQHLVTCYDFGISSDKICYMALEFLEGTTLEKALSSENLEMPQIVHIAEQMLDGLAACHKNNIVHRDLKPGNIMLCRMGGGESYIKIIDFGLVRLLEETGVNTITLHGDVFGSPLYMSPEQADGSHNVGPQTDVYAIGVMLYEMISGRVPFDGSSPLNVLMKHMNEPVPPLTGRDGMHVSPGLAKFVYKCLEKDARRRFKNAQEAARAWTKLALPNSGPFRLTNPKTIRTRDHDLADSLMAIPTDGAIVLDVQDGKPGLAASKLKLKKWLRTLNVLLSDGAVHIVDTMVTTKSKVWPDVRSWILRHRMLAIAGAGALFFFFFIAIPLAAFVLLYTPTPDEDIRAAHVAAHERTELGYDRALVGTAQFSAELRIDKMVALDSLERSKKAAANKKRRKRKGQPEEDDSFATPAERERDRGVVPELP